MYAYVFHSNCYLFSLNLLIFISEYSPNVACISVWVLLFETNLSMSELSNPKCKVGEAHVSHVRISHCMPHSLWLVGLLLPSLVGLTKSYPLSISLSVVLAQQTWNIITSG